MSRKGTAYQPAGTGSGEVASLSLRKAEVDSMILDSL
jgi:hypothetical protein